MNQYQQSGLAGRTVVDEKMKAAAAAEVRIGAIGRADVRFEDNCATKCAMPIDIREVPGELAGLEDDLGCLHNALSHLTMRLASSITPAPELANDSLGRCLGSPLGGKLHALRESIQYATRQLCALESGCQL